MSFLKSLGKAAGKDVQKPKDSLGGFSLLPSGVYDAKIPLCFIVEADSGAKGIEVHLEIEGQTHRETLWITNKEGIPYYVSKRDNSKNYLPGYINANDLCLLVAGKELQDMDTEEKTVKMYNYEEKAELPTEVEALTELHGQHVAVAILQRKEFKQEKNDDGVYVETDEVRETNIISKFFDPETYQTVNELEAESSAEFVDKWNKRWKDVVDDRTSSKKGKETTSSKKKGKFF